MVHDSEYLTFGEQPAPDGLAQAFLIGENFLGDSLNINTTDNAFYGHQLEKP